MSFDGNHSGTMTATAADAAACATAAVIAPCPTADPAEVTNARAHACRFCCEPLRHTFVDLGMSPLCESFLPREQLDAMEPFYPLCAYICERCLLVQLPQYVSAADIF